MSTLYAFRKTALRLAGRGLYGRVVALLLFASALDVCALFAIVYAANLRTVEILAAASLLGCSWVACRKRSDFAERRAARDEGEGRKRWEEVASVGSLEEDDEIRDLRSERRNRRPGPGAWMEPASSSDEDD